MAANLVRLEPREGDEVIVADNTDDGALERLGIAGARMVPAARERSSYHARNAGARAARREWLLFLDADCTPGPDLIDAYFAEPIPESWGAIAGQTLGEARQRALAARYARSRRLFDHEGGLIRAVDGGAAAGNLLVRRAAFEEIGGFAEGVRSGGDLDLCRRLAAAGWRLGFRRKAVVVHRHRDTMVSLLGAVARYGAGARWLNERYPGSSPPWPLRAGLALAARDACALVLRGRLEPALFRALDGLGLIAHRVGYRRSNAAAPGLAA